jgi:hypothetical protein
LHHHFSSLDHRDRVPEKVACCLSESGGTSAHDFALAHKFSVEFRAVEGEVDVEVDTVECALWRIHALKVLFEVFAAEVGGEGDDFLDAYACELVYRTAVGESVVVTYEDPWYTLGKHRHRKRREYPRT